MTLNDEKQPKGLKDLMAESQGEAEEAVDGKKLPQITEEKVAEQFTAKMADIKVNELEEVAKGESKTTGFPYINLVGFPINSDSLNSIRRDVAEREKVVCFYKSDYEIKIGSPNPLNPNLQEILETLKEETVSGKGEVFLISQHSLEKTIALYDKFPAPREFISGIKITGDELEKLQAEINNFKILDEKLAKEKNITKSFKMILACGMQSLASDIHIEAEEKKITLRYRIDGVLHVASYLPKKLWERLDSRIKNIAGLMINVTEKPQDGRITVYLKNDEKLEIRVSTLPTSYGESIVMRLLKSNVASLVFEDLGIRGKAFKDLEREISRPIGMIVTTGPTGSGKTTTLYAILNKLNAPETKIITLEDPVEYKLEGIMQSQIDHSKGYSFADGLRALMRQNPDIIMVGELRDLETVDVSIQAALTGHKVVSTLHTNDASGAIPRFLSMGAKPYLLAPALNAVIGQRLVRKIHEKCKVETKLDDETMERAKKALSNLPANSGYTVDINNLKFYKGQGCAECNNIGLQGRIGIYEIFTMTKDIEKEILSGQTSEYRIAEIAHDNGMITMVQDGLLKALDGITTVNEVFRVIE